MTESAIDRDKWIINELRDMCHNIQTDELYHYHNGLWSPYCHSNRRRQKRLAKWNDVFRKKCITYLIFVSTTNKLPSELVYVIVKKYIASIQVKFATQADA